MFAIIKTGGKQYKIQPGDIIKIESLGLDKGKKVNLNNVLAYNNNDKDVIGSPFLKNVEVRAEILENKRNKKVLVFKKRRRHNSRRLNGHKQSISVVRINEIALDGKVIGTIKDKVNTKTSIKKNTMKNSPLKDKGTSKVKAKKQGEKDGT
tara:strand:+ start:229 stop:681 length:453 start_codon:yes stop_codon:yes gene_type:complete